MFWWTIALSWHRIDFQNGHNRRETKVTKVRARRMLKRVTMLELFIAWCNKKHGGWSGGEIYPKLLSFFSLFQRTSSKKSHFAFCFVAAAISRQIFLPLPSPPPHHSIPPLSTFTLLFYTPKHIIVPSSFYIFRPSRGPICLSEKVLLNLGTELQEIWWKYRPHSTNIYFKILSFFPIIF